MILGGISLKKTYKIVAILTIMLTLYISMKSHSYITPYEIKKFLIGFGILAPIIYIILFTFVPLTLFPDALLAISAGLVFGIAAGILYTIIGALSGGTLAFYISRKLGKDKVSKKFSKYDKMYSLIEKRGFLLILCLRLIPLIPFDVISYVSGVTNVKYKDYMLATILGILPGVIILVSLGDAVSSVEQSRMYISISALVLLFALAPMAKKYIFNLEEKSSSAESKSA